jgi:hypothetical protein
MFNAFQYGTTPNPAAKELAVALIEGSADYLTMITECLLQSHNFIIRVFPAWPKDKNAKFENFVAEGDIKVSSEVKDGKVIFIKLTKGENRLIRHIMLRIILQSTLPRNAYSVPGKILLRPAVLITAQ